MYIIFAEDTCRLIGKVPIVLPNSIDSIWVYHYTTGPIDTDTYIIVNDDKEVDLLYSPLWGTTVKYDSQEKEKVYFNRVVEEIVQFH